MTHPQKPENHLKLLATVLTIYIYMYTQ